MRGSCCVGKWSTGQDIYSRISVARRSYRHEEQDKQKGFILTASVSVGLYVGLGDLVLMDEVGGRDWAAEAATMAAIITVWKDFMVG